MSYLVHHSDTHTHTPGALHDITGTPETNAQMSQIDLALTSETSDSNSEVIMPMPSTERAKAAFVLVTSLMVPSPESPSSISFT